MVKLSYKILAALLIVVTFVGIIILVLPKGDGQELEEMVPGVTFENVSLVGNSGGLRQWELLAKNLRQDGELVYIDHLDRLILFEAQQPKYYVYADKAILFPNENQLRFNDNVVIQDQAGLEIVTNQLIWYGDTEFLEFLGDTTVTIKGGNVDE